MSEKTASRTALATAEEPKAAVLPRSVSDRVVVIGTSTGGPQALTRLARAFPAGFPAPMAMALHIPPGYTEALAQRLDSESALEVLEARDGLEMKAGRAILARSGYHMKFEGAPEAATVALDLRPVEALYRPSIDVFFDSVVEHWVGDAVGVLLTGMGRDGAEGLKHMRERGFLTFAQDQESSAVYGMPKAAAAIGAAVEIRALGDIARRLAEVCA